jgi:glutaredoxin 3
MIKSRGMEGISMEGKKPEILVYSTPDCPYCSLAKTYLKGRGLDFIDYDVSKDKEKAREMVMKTQQGGVPVLQINGRLIIGFDRKLIEDALNKKGLVKREDAVRNIFFDPFGN